MEGMYNGLFFGGLIAAVLFLILAIVLFFILDIPKVFGDLSGRTARKTIKEIQTKGYENKSKQSAILKKTDRIQARDVNKDTEMLSGRTKKAQKVAKSDNTELLFDNNEETTNVLEQNEATDVLTGNEAEQETDILSGNEATDVLIRNGVDEATDVLARNHVEDEATDILVGDSEDEATDVLTRNDASEETEILVGNDLGKGSVVIGDLEETAVLISMPSTTQNNNLVNPNKDDETIVLKSSMGSTKLMKQKQVEILYNIIVVHTNESLIE